MGRGGGLAEFGNVGAGDEGPPVADDDDRLDCAVRLGLIDAPLEAVADGLRKAFTGGELIVTSATSPSIARSATELMAAMGCFL